MINIIANGKSYQMPDHSTVADLLQCFNIKSTYVVVQLDGTIIARDHFAMSVLQEGSRLEIVTLVGGG